MSLPLAAGHVLVRIGSGGPRTADAVLDALAEAFPTHTGRGRSRIGNAWEDPPTVTPQGDRSLAERRPDGSRAVPAPTPGISSSQAFDVRTPPGRRQPAPLPAAATATAALLGLPDDVETVARTLGELFPVRREDQADQGPYLALRLRIGPPG